MEKYLYKKNNEIDILYETEFFYRDNLIHEISISAAEI